MSPGANYLPSQEDLDNPCRICKEVYDGEVDMIQCGTCFKWFHEECLNDPVLQNLKEGDNWVCSECERKAADQGSKPKTSGSVRRKSLSTTKNVLPEDQATRSNVKIDKVSRANLRAIIKTQRQKLKTLRGLNKMLSQNKVDSQKSIKNNESKHEKKQIKLSDEESDESELSTDESSDESDQEESAKLPNKKKIKVISSSNDDSDEDEFTQIICSLHSTTRCQRITSF